MGREFRPVPGSRAGEVLLDRHGRPRDGSQHRAGRPGPEGKRRRQFRPLSSRRLVDGRQGCENAVEELGDIMDQDRPPLASYEDLAKMIDHSLVRPELTEADIVEGCRLAKSYRVA